MQDYDKLFIIPGNLDIGELEQPASTGIEGVKFYKGVPPSFVKVIKAFAKIHDIDLVLFDLGPSVGGWNQSIIMYSDYFCVPFLPDFLSKKGMDNFLKKATLSWADTFRTKLNVTDVPKFLGAFPQRSQLRKKVGTKSKSADDKGKKAVQSYETYIVKAYRSIKEKLPALREHGFLAENFRFHTLLGIPEFHSLGLDVQTSGHPISDLDYNHMHYEPSKAKYRSLNSGEKARKTTYHMAFKKILATFILNMKQEHHQQLGADFMKDIGIASLLRDDLPIPEELLAIHSVSKPKLRKNSSSQSYYGDEQIEALLE